MSTDTATNEEQAIETDETAINNQEVEASETDETTPSENGQAEEATETEAAEKSIDDMTPDELRARLAEVSTQCDKLNRHRQRSRELVAEIDEAASRVESIKAELKEAKDELESLHGELHRHDKFGLDRQKELPFNNADHPDVMAGKDRPHGTPALEALARMQADWGNDPISVLAEHGLTEKQCEKIAAVSDPDLSTVRKFRDFVNDDPWWHKKVKGFGEKYVDKATDALTSYIGQNPLPEEPDRPFTHAEIKQWLINRYDQDVDDDVIESWGEDERLMVEQWFDAVESAAGHGGEVDEAPECLFMHLNEDWKTDPVKACRVLQSTSSLEVEEAVALVGKIVEIVPNMPEAGQDFAESVARTAMSIKDTIEQKGFVTVRQETALNNMLTGLNSWNYGDEE